MALRPPVVQTIGVNTTAQWWWGSKIQRNGAEFGAAVVANRLSRTTQRTGSFRSRTNGDGRGSSTAGGGFGPRRPVVVGASIAFRGPEMVRTRSRRETMVRRQGDSILRKPIVVNPFVPPSTDVRPVEVKLAPSPRDGRRSNYRLAPPLNIIEPVVGVLASGGPGVRLTTIRPPAVHSKLSPPQVVTPAAAPFVAEPIFVRLAPSSRGRAQYRLGQPLVVYVQPLNFGPGVRLAPAPTQARKAHPKLSAPAVVTPLVVQVFFGPKVKLAPSTRLARAAHSRLPVVVYSARSYDPIQGYLTKPLDRVPPTISRLSPPTAVTAAPLAPPITVTLVRIRPFPTDASVFKPAVIAQAQGPQGGIGIQLAPQRRGTPKSHLSAPAVVTPVVTAVYTGPQITLVRIRPRRTLARLLSVPAAFRPIGFEIRVALAPSKRGTPKSRLEPPAVIYGAITLSGPRVRRASRRTTLPVARWKLSPPTVVFTAIELSGPEVTLVRIRPPRTIAVLRSPVVIGGSIAYGGPRVRLTSPLDRVPATISRLGPPVVLTAGETFSGPLVALAYSRRGKAKSRLLAVPSAFRPVGEIKVTLAPSRRGAPKSILREPTDTKGLEDQGRVVVHLAYSRRGRPLSILRKPVVVAPVLARPIRVELARIRPVRTLALLRAPVVVTPRVPQDATLDITLAYSVRGKPKSRLSAPTVVAPVLARPTAIYLAPSFRGTPRSRLEPPTVVFPFIARPIDITLARIRPVPTRWLLRRPTDLVDQQDLGFLRVHLAYSLRGKPKSRLSAPAVVAPVLARPIVTKLARIRPVATRWALKPPTVVRLAVELSGPEVTLVRIRPPRTMWFLRAPVAGAAQLKAERDLRVTLAYQSRGKPKSKLKPPVVVTAATPYFRREPVTLVRIRPFPTTTFLRPPTDTKGLEDQGAIAITLAPQRRGKAKPFLRPPVVVARFIARRTEITLAPSRFPRPKSVLRKPVVVQAFRVPVVTTTLVRIRPPAVHSFLRRPTDLVDAADLGTVRVHLAPSTRGRPKSKLLGVVYSARVYAPIRVELAPSTRLARRTHSKLPTVVYAARVFAPLSVTLTPSKRGVPKSRLLPPAVVRSAEAFLGPFVHLAYSVRGKTLSGLGQPKVIYENETWLQGPMVQYVASPRQARAAHFKLQAPTVVGAPSLARAIQVHLVRIEPVRVRWVLRPPGLAAEVCYGIVCGFDYAPVVTGSDSGATVAGGDSGATVSGSDSAATVTGATGSEGTVSGGDERREGC